MTIRSLSFGITMVDFCICIKTHHISQYSTSLHSLYHSCNTEHITSVVSSSRGFRPTWLTNLMASVTIDPALPFMTTKNMEITNKIDHKSCYSYRQAHNSCAHSWGFITWPILQISSKFNPHWSLLQCQRKLKHSGIKISSLQLDLYKNCNNCFHVK